MIIPLNEFEHQIDETILSRGFSYYINGSVIDFSEISSGVYEADVVGSDVYTVKLEVKNDVIISHSCECPYDLGPVCKHVVAVIFQLQEEVLDLNLSIPQIPKTPKKKRAKSINKQTKELLKAISHQDLMDFFETYSKKDKKFRNYFLTAFAHLSQNQSKELYQVQFHNILQTAAGRDGWISWSDMSYVVKSCQPFLDNAEQYLEDGKFENVFYISTALLEEMTKALEYGDDSSGDLGYFVDSALELLTKLTMDNLSTTLKQKFIEYAISAFTEQLFEGWDWHLGILEIASELVEKESDADIFLNYLNAVTDVYKRETAQSITLDLMRRFKNSNEVEIFINKHISNSKIRNQEIELAFERKNFNRAIELAKDGIKYDAKDKPGLLNEWYDWLLQVAIVQNDTPKIIEYARYRLIDDFRASLDYHQILKNVIPIDEWQPFLERIISELTPKTNWIHQELVRQIYIKEEWWDRLFLMLKENVSLSTLDANEQYLTKYYPTEFVELYSEAISTFVDKNIGRNHYQTACRYIRKMKKMGGTEQANELIDLLRKKYPQRRALLEELAMINDQ